MVQLWQLIESPAAANQDVAPGVTSLGLGSRDDDSNLAYARRCVVMEIVKAETDYVTHLHDVVQVECNQSIVHTCLAPVQQSVLNAASALIYKKEIKCMHVSIIIVMVIVIATIMFMVLSS